MRRILLTGATGLLGSRLLARWGSSDEVYAVARRPPTDDGGRVRWIEADLTGEDFVTALPRSVDAVVHLAQSRRFRDFPEGAVDVITVNTCATVRLLDYAHRSGATRFLYASSGGVYGHGAAGFREDDLASRVEPRGFYLATKRSSELLVESYSEHLTVAILRFFFIYGSGQSNSMLIPRLIDSVRLGKPIRLQGGDGLRINPVHVDDAAHAVTAALNLADSAKVNIAGPDILTLRQIGEAIGDALGREPLFDVRLEEEPRDLVADVTRMSQILAPPVRRLRDAVHELID